MKTHSILFICLTLLTISSCTLDEEIRPRQTKDGLFMDAHKDGRLWEGSTKVTIYPVENDTFLVGQNGEESIRLIIPYEEREEGKFIEDFNSLYWITVGEDVVGESYVVEKSKNSWIKITKHDKVNNILEGQFSLVFKEENVTDPKTVNFRGGKFRLKTR